MRLNDFSAEMGFVGSITAIAGDLRCSVVRVECGARMVRLAGERDVSRR
jgi:hypothetical protein